jgi:Cysteine rich repeat
MKTWLIPLGCLTIFSVAQAQERPPPAQGGSTVREACQADVQKFCPGVQPGGGRIRECIAAHKDELSPACRDALQSARARRPGAKGEGPPEQPAKPQ